MTAPATKKGFGMAKKVFRKPVMPKNKNHLIRGYIKSLNGKMIMPGDSFTDDQVSPERLKELKEKGLIRGTMTTEEKGTITK